MPTATASAAPYVPAQDGADELTLVDVREPFEHALGAIPGSILRPSGALRTAEGRAELLGHPHVVLYCKSGMRSQTCLTALQEDGHTGARTLVGGYDAFARPLP